MAARPQQLDYALPAQSYAYDEQVGHEDFAQVAENAKNVIEKVRRLMDAHDERVRRFTLAELIYFTGIDKQRLLQKIENGDFPDGIQQEGKRRYWSPEQLREILVANGTSLNRDPQTDPPATIAIQNNKGGSGKTTVATHLAVYATLKGMRVLLVDMDPQGSTTAVANYQPDSEVNDSMTVMPYIRQEETDLRYAVKPVKHWPGLYIVPAASGLSEIDVDLPVFAMQDPAYIFYTKLYEGLATIAQDFDLVVIDSPPSFTFSALNCIFGAVGLVVPVPPQSMVFDSYRKFNEMLARFLKSIEALNGSRKTFNWVRVLITMYSETHNEMASLVRLTAGRFAMEPTFIQTPVLGGKENRTIYDITKYLGGRQTYLKALASADRVNQEFLDLILKMWPSKQRGAGR